MIKVESNMLVLDNSFSKEDVLAIDEFMKIVEKRTEERIIKLLEEMPWQIYSGVGIDGKPIESVCTPKVLIREDVIALIKGEK